MSTPAPDQDSDSRTDIPICVAVFTLAVAATAVSLRIYTRKVLINQLGADDYFLIFACDFAVAYNTNFGLGRHIWTIPKEWVPLYLRTFYVSIVMYNAALMAVKATFLTQYCRIFSRTTRPVFAAFAGSAVFIGCWALSQLLVAIFTCHPVDGYWNLTEQAACIPNHPFWEVNAAGNIVTDVMILILPIPMLESLNLPRRQRHILIGIFSLGIFTVCISLIRIRFLKQYDDFTWENVESSGWSMGELASGLTCACLPTLRPLIGRFTPWLSSRADTYLHHHGRTSDRDVEKNDTTTRGSRSSGAAEHTTTNQAAGGRDDGWPAPPPGAPGAFIAGVPRMDSGGDSSDGVVGLQAARDGLARKEAPRPAAAGGSGRPSIERKPGSVRSRSRESVRFMQPTVQTDIRAPTPVLSPSLPKSAIQVRRDVHQASESTGA